MVSALTTKTAKTLAPEINIVRARPENLAQVVIIESFIQEIPWTLSVFNLSLFTDEQFWLAQNCKTTEVLGFIICAVYKPEAEITNFGIHPEYQNQGLGQKLMQHLFINLQNLAIEKINLEVRVGNERAINFYKKFQFVTVGRRKNYYQKANMKEREDGLLMTKFGFCN